LKTLVIGVAGLKTKKLGVNADSLAQISKRPTSTR
jgi:hypothetical protein